METIIEKYSRVGHFDFIKHFNDVMIFNSDKLSTIVEFFTSRKTMFPTNEINELKTLRENQNKANSLINDLISKDDNKTLEHFDVQEIIDILDDTISLMENTPKFLRVSKDNVYSYKTPVIEYYVKQRDTLESISLKFFGTQERWQEIAEQNNVNYYEVGSNTWINRKLIIRLDTFTNSIPGIIDIPIGEDMLGKDILKEFEFANDDINVVNGNDCFEQACNIMFDLKRGTVPEDYNFGHILNEAVGNNLQIFNNINIITELKRIFSVDPTVASFMFAGIKIVDDSVELNFAVISINGFSYEKENYLLKL